MWAQAVNLKGSERASHPFVRLSLSGQVLHTCVMWQTTSPAWHEKLSFKCAKPIFTLEALPVIVYIHEHKYPYTSTRNTVM